MCSTLNAFIKLRSDWEMGRAFPRCSRYGDPALADETKSYQLTNLVVAYLSSRSTYLEICLNTSSICHCVHVENLELFIQAPGVAELLIIRLEHMRACSVVSYSCTTNINLQPEAKYSICGHKLFLHELVTTTRSWALQ